MALSADLPELPQGPGGKSLGLTKRVGKACLQPESAANANQDFKWMEAGAKMSLK